MTAVIVHYHLGPGGVLHVITASSRALSAGGIPHVVLVGAAPAESMATLPVRVIPELGYHPASGKLTANELVNLLRHSATEALGHPPDIWHFHNHSLGKNPLMAGVVALLAAENERIILQIHDLAEDGRPANYLAISGCREIYPFSPRIHYAFLNSRDLAIFTAAGLPPENASVLANPITLTSPLPAQEPSSPTLILAPVRGIRRKNPGELVFLSAIAPRGTRIAISRAPLDPDARVIHDRWADFARRQQLPIGFDVVDHFTPAPGAAATFESWLSHATHIITCSVAEGFGLPFLEAAALEKPLIGRNLAHLTADHALHDIQPGDLYDALLIPVHWIDLTILHDYLETTLERNYRFYHRHLSRETRDATFNALLHDGWLDFGNLPEPLQQGVIERMTDPHSRMVPLVRKNHHCKPAIEWLTAAIANHEPSAKASQLAPYSLQNYQKNMAALYSKLSDTLPASIRFIPPEKILDAYLTPSAFHFLLSAIHPLPAPPVPYRAVIFDIYGTLLIAPAGGVIPDPIADPVLRKILTDAGHVPPESPSTLLHEAILRHHAAAQIPFPEIDLRALWRELLELDPETNIAPLVESIENAWHPSRPMPGAEKFISKLSASGILLGILSNAQCNTLTSLGSIADLFAPELTILSYQFGIAKPSPELFEILANRLADRGISPSETLYIGNDPLHDIIPAAAQGFKTALFTGHPNSLRPGECEPDTTFTHWTSLESSSEVQPSTHAPN